jgi:hypothetical protein
MDGIYEAAEERFCIKTIEGHIDDVTAIKSIEKKYGREIALKVWKNCGGKK